MHGQWIGAQSIVGGLVWINCQSSIEVEERKTAQESGRALRAIPVTYSMLHFLIIEAKLAWRGSNFLFISKALNKPGARKLDLAAAFLSSWQDHFIVRLVFSSRPNFAYQTSFASTIPTPLPIPCWWILWIIIMTAGDISSHYITSTEWSVTGTARQKLWAITSFWLLPRWEGGGRGNIEYDSGDQGVPKITAQLSETGDFRHKVQPLSQGMGHSFSFSTPPNLQWLWLRGPGSSWKLQKERPFLQLLPRSLHLQLTGKRSFILGIFSDL